MRSARSVSIASNLIVQFARELQRHGRTVAQAAIAACRLRLRPILMTHFAFIMSVVPLVGAADRALQTIRPAHF